MIDADNLKNQITDEALVNLLPGFTNGFTEVNGIRLHYVEGGQGYPLVLLPGWPETWWAYHKVLSLLASRYRVIAVDLRGMGSSDKPVDGYEKKTMASDILNLIHKLGYGRVHIAGHDIGAHVAFSFAANFPNSTSKLILLDTPHPDEGMYRLPMLPALKITTEKAENLIYPWWLAFNQVTGLPEQLLAGRYHYLLDWVFNDSLLDQQSISEFDRAVYAAAYDSTVGIRGGNGWYQAFPQDIADSKTYGKLAMPVLGIGGSGYDMLAYSLPTTTADFQLAKVKGSGHFHLS